MESLYDVINLVNKNILVAKHNKIQNTTLERARMAMDYIRKSYLDMEKNGTNNNS